MLHACSLSVCVVVAASKKDTTDMETGSKKRQQSKDDENAERPIAKEPRVADGPRRRHNCLQSTLIEAFTFGTRDGMVLPDEECPICLGKLSEKSDLSCCGGYAKPLIVCGHWAHVGCQIDRNPEPMKCTVCGVTNMRPKKKE